MIRNEIKQRSLNACLIAAIIHVCLAILLTFFYYTKLSYNFDDVMDVSIYNPEKPDTNRRTLKRPIPKKVLTAKRTENLADYRPKHVKLTAASNLIDETVRPSDRLLMHSATEKVSDSSTSLPDVTTQSQQLIKREDTIAKSVQSPFEITSGKGKESLRQRVKGDGKSGFNRLESTGTADIGDIGQGIGDGIGGKGDASGNSDKSNPFAEALERIADHIIGTREGDKVNVVFVLDTSASMRDNIQQVANNLYSMTDAFDLVNIEYHLGMTEFSVRQEGQELKTRNLMPDVGILRKRMKEVQLSGDENALDALVDTLDYIEFHADANKHLILVTDEPASTSFRGKDAKTNMQTKVIEKSKFDKIRVNVLGFPETFQQKLAEVTGGVWEVIPGSTYNPSALPSNRAGNAKLLKAFRDIAIDIRRSANKSMFGLNLKFELPLTDGKISLQTIQKEIIQNGIELNKNIFLSENAMVLVNKESNLWVLCDSTNRKMRVIQRVDDTLYVYVGNYPQNCNFSQDSIASMQRRSERWVLTEQQNNQIYTFKKDEDRFIVYIGGQPGTASNSHAKPNVDIVVMLDYSRSMGGKSQAVMLGLSTLIGRLSIFPLKYRIGLIRFAEAKDAIKTIDGVDIKQMPLNEVIIENLLEDPFGGDEHLIDAIVEGLPQVKFSPFAKRYLLILTDEPTTGKYTPEQAIQLCKSLGITAYIIGHPNPNDFQTTLTQETFGNFFTMPRHLDKPYPNQ